MENSGVKSVIILRGGPAVGKTTLAEELTCKMPKSARIEQDILRYMIVGGLVAAKSGLHPSNAPEEYLRQCRLGDLNALALARNFAVAGFIPVIAGFNGGESAETFYELNHPRSRTWYPSPELLSHELTDLNCYQIILDAPSDVLEVRLKTREFDSETIEFVLDQRQRFLDSIDKSQVWLQVNTIENTPQEIAELILEKLSEMEPSVKVTE